MKRSSMWLLGLSFAMTACGARGIADPNESDPLGNGATSDGGANVPGPTWNGTGGSAGAAPATNIGTIGPCGGASVGADGTGGAPVPGPSVTGGAAGVGGALNPVPMPTGCTCTRRLDGASLPQCPRGIGQAASTVISPAGGGLAVTGQQGTASGVPFSIDVPAKALAIPTAISITETAIAPPAGYVDYSPVYAIEPASAAFAVPVAITVPWSNVDGSVDGPLSIYLAASAQGPFVRVADSYVNAGFLQGTITSGGYVFAGYPQPAGSVVCGATAAASVDGGSCASCAADLGPARSLECFCQNHVCRSTLDEALQAGSGFYENGVPAGWHRMQNGCGLVSLSYLYGSAFVFDAATGKLVGASRWSDIGNPGCQTPVGDVYGNAAGGEIVLLGDLGIAGCANVTTMIFGDAGPLAVPEAGPPSDPPCLSLTGLEYRLVSGDMGCPRCLPTNAAPCVQEGLACTYAAQNVMNALCTCTRTSDAPATGDAGPDGIKFICAG